MAELPVLLSETSFSAAPTDSSSQQGASLSSTPPTTVADSISLASDGPKPEVETEQAPLVEVHEEPVQPVIVAKEPLSEPDPPPSTGRARRARQAPVYNLSKLSGTDVHGKRAAKGDIVGDRRRRRTISGGGTLIGDDANDTSRRMASRAVQDGIEALDLEWSVGKLSTPRAARSPRKMTTKDTPPARRIGTRQSGVRADSLAEKLSSLGKRGRKTFEKGVTRISRELRRLQDTNEFARIDERPIWNTVWSNGKYVDPSQAEEEEAPPPPPPPRKRARKADGADEDAANEDAANERKDDSVDVAPMQKRMKMWLEKGLYAGQEGPTDVTKGLTTAERKGLADLPELKRKSPENKTLPMPIYNGFRMLLSGRDFRLPYDICNPVPPGQPKPDEWRKMTKNRFIGDAGAYWKKTPHFKDFQSKCVCKPEDGCAEDCQNRIMLYECDETNCNTGKQYCQNRAFQNLTARTKQGGRFRVGVEVIKTSDRGYGVRSNRCFEPNQIIMEYAGEIITEEECERRMNEKYKDNECYYLMSFDQNMIIDATTGSIARFVNHSCSPNCRMIKWIVSGQPRMALFAGDKPIMTGDELTYDYNFDPFSAKNVQKCLCGSANCRGVLGPRPKPPPKKLAEATSAKAKRGAKRKLKELLEDRGTAAPAAKPVAKKPRITSVKAVKRSLSQVSLKKAAKGAVKGAAARGRAAAKGAATVIRKSVTSISVSAKSSSASLKNKPGRVGKTYRKTTTTSALRLYGKSGAQKKTATATKQASAVSIAAAARAKAKARAAAGEAAAAPTNPSATIVAASTEASPSKAKAKAKGAAKRSPVSAASKATNKVVKKVTKIPARSRIGITKPPVKSPSKVRPAQKA